MEDLKMADYLKVLDAAKYLSVTAQTLRNWDKLGKLKPHRHPINNYRLYKQTDLDKILGKIERK